jgi:hypothetical protein
MVKPLIVAMTVAMAIVPTALISAQSGVTGDWEIELTTQTGITTWQARFEQDGDRVGGEIDLGDNEVLSVDGSIDGAMLKFVIVVPDLDGDQPISFEGELDGDRITGAEGSFSWYGTGDWTALRK